jgi:hypothetical protein
MKKVQERVRKIVRILPAMALIVHSSFSPFYFSLPQRTRIFYQAKRHAIGTNFAIQRRKNTYIFNNLWM